jgi:hypothetical protein
MTKITTKPDSSQPGSEMAVDLFESWFDPIETEVRARARGFIEELGITVTPYLLHHSLGCRTTSAWHASAAS